MDKTTYHQDGLTRYLVYAEGWIYREKEVQS